MPDDHVVDVHVCSGSTEGSGCGQVFPRKTVEGLCRKCANLGQYPVDSADFVRMMVFLHPIRIICAQTAAQMSSSESERPHSEPVAALLQAHLMLAHLQPKSMRHQ